MKIEEAKKLREMSVEVENPDLDDFILDEENKQITLRNKPLEYVLACEPKAIKRLVDSYLKAVEVIYFYGTYQPRQHPEGYYEIHISPGMGGEDRFGTRAREFLRSVE